MNNIIRIDLNMILLFVHGKLRYYVVLNGNTESKLQYYAQQSVHFNKIPWWHLFFIFIFLIVFQTFF